MQFNKIALASAAAAVLGFAGQAQALTAPAGTTVYMTGASATAANYVAALKKMCTDAGGAAKVFKNNTTVGTLGNFFTVQCQNAAGTAVVDFDTLTTSTVAFNVDGGSFTAITHSTTGGTATKFITPTATTFGETCNICTDTIACAQTTTTESQVSEGGFMDMEPAAFGAQAAAFGDLSGNVSVSNFSQAFYVAVSKGLYDALQTAQGVAEPAGADERQPQYQPTISRAQYASIVNSDTFGEAKTNPGAFFGVPTGKLTLCRRVDSSGTQAASNQYFLNTMTGIGPNGGASTPISAAFPATASFAVNEGATTGAARTCLGSTTAYAIGVLSAENAPKTSDTYRYVKLGGVAIGDTLKNKAAAVNGAYDFAFQSFTYCAAGVGSCATMDAINNTLGDLTNVTGLYGKGESAFHRNDNNANPITKN